MYRLRLNLTVERLEAGEEAEVVKDITEVQTHGETELDKLPAIMHHMMLRVGARLAEIEPAPRVKKPRLYAPKARNGRIIT